MPASILCHSPGDPPASHPRPANPAAAPWRARSLFAALLCTLFRVILPAALPAADLAILPNAPNLPDLQFHPEFDHRFSVTLQVHGSDGKQCDLPDYPWQLVDGWLRVRLPAATPAIDRCIFTIEASPADGFPFQGVLKVCFTRAELAAMNAAARARQDPTAPLVLHRNADNTTGVNDIGGADPSWDVGWDPNADAEQELEIALVTHLPKFNSVPPSSNPHSALAAADLDAGRASVQAVRLLSLSTMPLVRHELLLVDEAGRPLVARDVKLHRFSQRYFDGSLIETRQTDSAGRIALDLASDEQFQLELPWRAWPPVDDARCRHHQRILPIGYTGPWARGQTTTITVYTLAQPHALRGHFRLENRDGLATATGYAKMPAEELLQSLTLCGNEQRTSVHFETSVTDTGVDFYVPDLPPGRYQFVHWPLRGDIGYELLQPCDFMISVDQPPATREPMELVLRKQHSDYHVTFEVVDQTTGLPLENIEIETPSIWNSSARERTDVLGRIKPIYLFHGLQTVTLHRDNELWRTTLTARIEHDGLYTLVLPTNRRLYLFCDPLPPAPGETSKSTPTAGLQSCEVFLEGLPHSIPITDEGLACLELPAGKPEHIQFTFVRGGHQSQNCSAKLIIAPETDQYLQLEGTPFSFD